MQGNTINIRNYEYIYNINISIKRQHLYSLILWNNKCLISYQFPQSCYLFEVICQNQFFYVGRKFDYYYQQHSSRNYQVVISKDCVQFYLLVRSFKDQICFIVDCFIIKASLLKEVINFQLCLLSDFYLTYFMEVQYCLSYQLPNFFLFIKLVDSYLCLDQQQLYFICYQQFHYFQQDQLLYCYYQHLSKLHFSLQIQIFCLLWM